MRKITIEAKVSVWYRKDIYVEENEYSKDLELDLQNETFQMEVEEITDPHSPDWYPTDSYVDDVFTQNQKIGTDPFDAEEDLT